ncbi:neogenin-like isoform X3 [Eriocheir sinensis]|uniref:neogenin-like isoform X3 n=1 Tax=Eriocheir sinensis TaxID=95602 RepID=UPI0021C6369C|nr:neogenin-like isoform X3 [Eriocheir sinensis]
MCPGHHAGALHQGVQEQSPAGARLTNDTPSIWCLRNRECSHAGEYCCQANKSKVSQQATLTVKEAYALRDPQRPVLTAQPKSTIGKVGDKITVDCAANGYPEPAMVCLRDSATIHMADLDTLFCGTTSSSLHIHGLQEEDEGTYRCRAENRDLDTLFCGTTTSSLHIHGLQEEDEGTYMCWAENREDSLDAVAHIQVQVAPRFLRQPANALAYEKENVELECSVYGQPEPSLHWLKNGELLVETDFCDGVDIYHLQSVSGNNLQILGLVRQEDSGMYQCVAHSSPGTPSCVSLSQEGAACPHPRTRQVTDTVTRVSGTAQAHHYYYSFIIISWTPAPRSSQQGMATTEELPTFSIQTLPPCLLKDLSPLSLTYSCTLCLHFTGGRPLAFPPSISLTYTLLVILLSSIRSMWPNHFKVCRFTSSTTPHFFPSPL